MMLEGQIVCSVLSTRLCRWEWSIGCGCCILLWGEGSGSTRGSASDGGGGRHGVGHLTTNNIVRANVIEPTSLILVCINIKLHGNFFAGLNVELLDTVFAKYSEYHASGILTRYFNDIILAHP